MSRVKIGSKKWYKDECDKLFSLIVRSRGCEETNIKNPGKLNCCHIMPRGYLATRWDLENAICLTWGRHRWYTSRPLEWEEFVVSKVGLSKYDDLKRRARAGIKRSLEDYQELYDKLVAKAQAKHLGFISHK